MEQKRIIGLYDYTVVLTYLGMVFAFHGILKVLNGAYSESILCLMSAGVCDMFDGAVASTKQRNKFEKHFGIQIDSLCDLISFGVLPAIFVYMITGKNAIVGALACIYTLCGLIRLAYFNVQEYERQKMTTAKREVYLGVPITTSAIILPLTYLLYSQVEIIGSWIFILAMIILGAGFVTGIKIRKPDIVGKLVMQRIVPRYAIMPIVGMLLANLFTYFVTPIWTDQLTHYSFETEIDAKIPFLPIFVIPYILAYLQWIIGYLMVARTNQEYCKKIMYGEITAKIIVCILFVCLPTTMTRASIDNSDICSKIVSVIYTMDKPVNLFPSIHCLESWICFRSCLNKRFFSAKYMVFMGCMTVLVFLSTVFIKQHVVLDMLGAILVAEIGAIIVNMMSIKDGSKMALKKSKDI